MHNLSKCCRYAATKNDCPYHSLLLLNHSQLCYSYLYFYLPKTVTSFPKNFKTLKNYFNCDSSNLIKRTLLDLYEEIKVREIIEQYEDREKTSKSGFVKIEDILE